MGVKTTQYPTQQTTFDPLDEFDVSAYLGIGSYESRYYKYSDLLSNLNADLTIPIPDLDEVTTVGASTGNAIEVGEVYIQNKNSEAAIDGNRNFYALDLIKFRNDADTSALNISPPASITVDRYIDFQDGDGTLAFLSDIPSTPSLQDVVLVYNEITGDNTIRITGSSGESIEYTSNGFNYTESAKTVSIGIEAPSTTGGGIKFPDVGGASKYLAISVNGNYADSHGDISISAGGAVDSVNGQTGAVVLDATDVDALKRDGSNSNSDVDISGGAGYSLNAKSLHVKGTGGAGHLGLKHQSAGITASASESSIGANSSGDPVWKNDGNALQNIMLRNADITGATKTKITYDAQGKVTAGADATTADIADSTDKRYITDAELTVIGNTSGTNTGDETATTIGTLINGATNKTTPVDADYIGLMDSAASNILKKLSFANLWTWIKGKIESVVLSLTNGTTATTQSANDNSTKVATTAYVDTNALFTIPVLCGALSPSDSTTYYGMTSNAPSATAANQDINIGYAFKIIGVQISVTGNTTAGSNENITAKIRNTTQSTSSTIGTFTSDGGSASNSANFTFTGLSISVAAGDFICMEFATPAWATNPVGTFWRGYLICSRA